MLRRPLYLLIALLVLAGAWFLLPFEATPDGAASDPNARGGPAGMGPPSMDGPPSRGGPPSMGGRGGLPVAVVTAAVSEQPLVRELKSLGTAQAREAVEITAKVSNVVTTIQFEDGQAVQAGEVLIQLDSAQARAELAAAEAAREPQSVPTGPRITADSGALAGAV